MGPPRLRIDGKTFKDPQNREITLRGINVAGESKYPANPDVPTYVSDKFFDADNVSFVNRPFSIQDSHTHFARLRKWGYNTIRYVFTWEAIEHTGPGIYDQEWVAFTIEVLRIAKQYGFYVIMDPHQDVVGSLLVYSLKMKQALRTSSGQDYQEDRERRCGHCMPQDSIRRPSRKPKQPSFKTHTTTRPSSPR